MGGWLPILFSDGALQLDDTGVPKIADFGVSREKIQTEQMTRIGTPSYCAPEIMRNLKYSERDDIYSFGMLLHTMITGMAPFKDQGKNGAPPNQLQIMMMVSVKKLRPKIPETCPPFLKKLIEECWQHDPKARPTAQEVVNVLSENM
jgi:serine/threonine protein kinase